MSTFQQTVSLPGTPAQVFDALMNADQHSAFTGAPAEIDARSGGLFSCHGGMISGVTLDLIEGQRIVQAWRAGNWDEGVFSVVRYDLQADEVGTQVTLTHSAVPEGAGEMLKKGWYDHYWNKLPAHLA